MVSHFTVSRLSPRWEKIDALLDVARFNPKFTVLIIGLGLVAAVLEGVGLSFILPIVEIVQAEDPVAEADGLMAAFVTVYQTLGIPFTLGFVVVGVAVVMTARYTMSFIVAWFREALRTYYIRDLQVHARGCVSSLQGKPGRVPRSRSEIEDFRDDSRRSLSNHLAPKYFTSNQPD